jgi:hypothetical protein
LEKYFSSFIQSNWISARLLLILAKLLGLDTKALDFVLAFPQAHLDTPIYMEIPVGVSVNGIHQNKKYVLCLLKSLYGLKQASSNWYACLKQGLEDSGFKESQSDPCVFMRKDMIILVYVDDCILVSPSSAVIKTLLRVWQIDQRSLHSQMKAPWTNILD